MLRPPQQILELKIADIAVGSAAFLVETCRQLADVLVRAWRVHGGRPALPPDETEELLAMRNIAQRCLYGVDRNPMAVDLAKLSLWLATLPDELTLNVQAAPLARDADWLPAVENRGEGVFLLFDAATIASWLQRPAVQGRAKMLLGGFSAWASTHPNSSRKFPGVPYYLLHSFSHLLMTAISLDCGYPASSLRERIYALPAEGTLPDRYGILIFTGSSDAEGTLGGLVEAARRMKDFVRKALELASLCSNDPICAHHQPGEHDHAPLLGAACHGCVLVPETSCEQRNEFLDRALVVPTVEACGAEFFAVA